MSAATETTPGETAKPRFLKQVFVRVGVLPILLVIAFVVFSLMSGRFLTVNNLINVVRQSVYLTIVSLGQMLALLTGGFDLSVGTILALTSVVGASAMAMAAAAWPNLVWISVLIGAVAGLAAGTLVGIASGVGVAVFGVSPFIMTLGLASVGFGVALYLTGGMPVYGMPKEFGQVFGFGDWLHVPVPIYVAVIAVVFAYMLVARTRLGRYFYAVGGNIRAAQLSGVPIRKVLFTTYVLTAFLAAIAGMLLTARLDTGEANIGAAMPLQSIAACVIGGVSLRGGVGRIENVVLGALFIGLVQNGMDLARIESYLQTVVLGLLLILAVIVDRIRLRYIADVKA